jgi:hypothetical protein
MNEKSPMPRQEGSHTGERSGASLLVRCWLEPRTSDESPILRGYLKNLRTGEEHFIKDLDTVSEHIRIALDSATAAESDLPILTNEARLHGR